MKNALLSVLFVALLVACGQGPETDVVEGLHGIVVDEEGAPVAGAQVVFHRLEAGPSLLEAHRGETDEHGGYAWEGAPAGSYVIYVRKGSFAALKRNVVVERGVRIQASPMVLQAAATVTGVVELSDRADPAGARVVLEGTGLEVVSDADGAYRLEGVPAGTYALVAGLEGYQSAHIGRVELQANEVAHGVDFLLVPLDGRGSGVIEGSVARSDGAAGEGAVVSVAGTGWMATADAQGAYRIEDVPTGEHELLAVLEGHASERIAAVRVEDGEVTAGVDFSLAAIQREGSGGVSGAVTLSDGGDPAGTWVSVAGTDLDAIVGSDGRYAISGVPAGSHALVAFRSGYAVARVEGVVVETERITSDVDVALEALEEPQPGVIAGTVTLADGAAPGGTVVSIEGSSLEVVAGSSGSYELAGVPEGSHDVVAFRDGYVHERQDAVAVSAGTTTEGIDFTLQPEREHGSLRGTVTLYGADHDGGALVYVPGTSYVAVTDASGAYQIDAVPVDTYEVAASASGYLQEVRTGVTVAAGAEAGVDFTLHTRPPPEIDRLSHVTVHRGGPVLIHGRHFGDDPEEGAVTFDDLDAWLISDWSDTLIRAYAPSTILEGGPVYRTMDLRVEVEGRSTAPQGIHVVRPETIAAGHGFTVAITDDDLVDVFGQEDDPRLSAPNDLEHVVSVAAGSTHALALTRDGTVTAWGRMPRGGSDLIGSVDPSPPPGLANVVAVASGTDYALALKSDGTITAWGMDDHGRVSGAANVTDAVAIAAGARHALALRDDGSIVAWGDDAAQQVSRTPGVADFRAVAAGDGHSLAISSGGCVIGWGDNTYGQTKPKGVKCLVADAIAAGADHSVAIDPDGMLHAWGRDDKTQATVPDDAPPASAIAAGDEHSVYLTRLRLLDGFGNNEGGQLMFPRVTYRAP